MSVTTDSQISKPATAASAPTAAQPVPVNGLSAASTTASVAGVAGAGTGVVPPSSVGVSVNAGAAAYASASLYVGDLAPDVTEALLFEIFNAVGPVASVRVCRDASSRRSLGYAYVNFHRPEDAERALDTMNFKNIRNKPCRIMWSQRDPALRRSNTGNIFVNHLIKAIDNKQLYDAFSMFGNILSCKVATNATTKQSLGYGFVHFESEDAAKAAIEKRSGTEWLGNKIEVSMFKPKKERDANNQYKFTNVFVKNLPAETTKEDLEQLFDTYGAITSSMISRSTDKDKGESCFGFVNFSAPEQASAAVEAVNDQDYKGRKLFVARAQKKEEREKELRERFELMKAERARKYAGVNLYVKNLPEQWTDEKLTTEFGKFGQITSARIMKDDSGKSRAFGFVCFSTPEEATRAVTEMNGRMEEGKPLYVALAQRKDARRVQLEAQYAARLKLSQQQAGLPFPSQPMLFPGMGGFQRNAAAMANFMYPQQAVNRFMQQPQHSPLQSALRQQQQQQQQQPFNMPINYSLMPVNRNAMPVMPLNAAAAAAAAAAALQNQVPNMQQPALRQMPPQQLNAASVAARQAAVAAAQAAQQQSQLQQRGTNQQSNAQRPAGVMVQSTGVLQPVQMMNPGMQLNHAAALQKAPLSAPMLQQQSIRYSDNVRNRSQAAALQQQQQQQLLQPIMQQQHLQADALQMPAPNEPLTIKALAAAPEELRKQMIGERLFPLIKMHEPLLAGKITGMLLEMDNGELIHLLESQQALNEKIQEALAVLHAHPAHEQEQQGEQETDK